MTIVFAMAMAIFGLATISLKNKCKPAVWSKALTTICAVLMAALHSSGHEWLIVAGLVCGVFGDVFLEYPGTFVPGMLSFLIGHTFYSTAFALKFGIPSLKIFLFVYICLGALYAAFLYKKLGKLKLAVGVYVVTIATMFAFSFGALRSGINMRVSFLPVGAGLFVFSDFYLAYDRFVKNLPSRHWIVLGTYFIAQCLIALSTVVAHL